MMCRAAIFHAASIGNLVVRQEEENCPAELVQGIKHKFSTCKLSIFGCTVSMRKRDRDVSKIGPRALEGVFSRFTKGEHVHLVYLPTHAR